MRIGVLSAKAGVNIQTIRFYEREKLLPKSARTPSGYRMFTDADLERVRFIKQSQQLGFTLKEVKELIVIHESAKVSSGRTASESKEWAKAFQIAKERLDLIDQKIQFLKILRRPLAAALEQTNPRKRLVCPAAAQVRKRPRTTARLASRPAKNTD